MTWALDLRVSTEQSVQLEETTLEGAYSSLKAVIAEVATALNAVSSENLGDPEGVFAAVNYALRNYQDGGG